MNILIIEDEARIARRIERMLSNIFEGEETSIQLADSLEEGLLSIKERQIDLLFLDLNLNGKDGFDILESVVSESFHTIIISAYKEKAIRAYEYGVLDFVPKPFDEDRLSRACQRITKKQEKKNQLKFLAIKKKGKHLLIKAEDILFIKGAGIYTEIYLKNATREIHSKSLESLNMILPSNFERIHKSYLVDMNQAKGIISEPGSKYSLELQNGEILPVGRTKIKELTKRWFS